MGLFLHKHPKTPSYFSWHETSASSQRPFTGLILKIILIQKILLLDALEVYPLLGDYGGVVQDLVK